ncbi:MAG TPA: choice-of-anchor D domain-containing protein [Actinomycetota bacterium]
MSAVFRYRDFDMALERAGTGYRARVFASPAGEGSAQFDLPFGEPELNELLVRLRSSAGAPPAGGDRDADLDRIRAFGGGLFDAVFRDVVGELLRSAQSEASRDGNGLRLRLRLDPSLSGIPWELLYNRPLDRFLSLSAETPVVRYLEIPEPVRTVTVTPPLRVLVMISSPADHPPLDVEAEWAKLNQALAGLVQAGTIALDRLDDATFPALQDRLMGSPYHVFHFLGHGGFDPRDQDGVLLLEGPGNAGVVVPGHDLGVALHDAHLRLAVLNTCEGARGSARDPFAGTAQGLVQQGVPAVVAMQFQISDDAATTVAQEFYAALAMGYPVDAALAEARKAVYFTGNRVEWATPVLYLRAPDGRLFDIAGAAPPVAAHAEVDPLAVPGAAPEPAGVVYAGDKVLALRDPAGAVAAVTVPEERPIPRLRRPPIDLRPKDFPDLLGRDAEIEAVAQAFLQPDPTRPPVEVSGPDGAGKTALLRNVAHHPAAQFPDGAVYTSSPQPAADLLQFLFQTFYETPTPLKPTEAELRQHLHAVRALVELDDLRLSRDDVELVSNVVPNAQLVLASRERVLFEEGPAVALHGLSPEAAVALLERRLGRALAPEERPAAEALAGAVGGLPLELVKAASRVRDDRLPLAEVASEAGAPPPPVLDPASLTGTDDRVRAVLQAAGAPIHAEVLAQVLGLPPADAAPVLDDMEERGIIQSNSPRYDLAEPVPAGVAGALDVTPWPAMALDHMVVWAEEHRDDHPRILEEIDGLVGMLGWAERHERWPETVRLGRAIDGALAEAGRWDRWEAVLVSVLGAARRLGDRNHEAWAMHQLGTRALGLDRAALAADALRQALAIREAIGDRHGAELTRRNLQLATGGGPPPGRGGGPDRPRPRPRWWLRIVVAGVVVGALGAGAAVVVSNLGNGGAAAEAAAGVDPGSVTFDDEVQDTQSATSTVRITSEGDSPLEIGTARLGGPNRKDFVLTLDQCSGARLDRGQACDVQVAFLPAATGPRNATLVLDTNAPGGPVAVDLRGVGLAREPDVPGLALDPPTLPSFTEPFQRQQLTVLSTGRAPLRFVAGVRPGDGEEQAEFRVDGETSTCRPEVAAGDSCVLDIVFEPREGGIGQATLTIESNAGVPLILQLSGTPHADVPEGATFVKDFAIIPVTNSGTALLTITGVEVTGPDAADFQVVDNTCDSLVIGDACGITVAFQPAEFQGDFKEATLSVFDNTPEGHHDVSLTISAVD